MSAIRVKICPECHQPSPTDAQWCPSCRHRFRTKFAPDPHPAPPAPRRKSFLFRRYPDLTEEEGRQQAICWIFIVGGGLWLLSALFPAPGIR